MRGLDWGVEGTRLGNRADLRWQEVQGRGDGGCRALDLVADQSGALRVLGGCRVQRWGCKVWGWRTCAPGVLQLWACAPGLEDRPNAVVVGCGPKIEDRLIRIPSVGGRSWSRDGRGGRRR